VSAPAPTPARAPSPAAFVDRDGVINELTADPDSGRPESPLRVQDVILVAGAAAALRRLAAAGLLLCGISNQPAAAKGTVSRAELDAVQQRVIDLLAVEDVRFDAFRACLHHPDGIVPELTGACDCRKPAPGMLLDAARELEIDLTGSWMIGDTDSDVQAGAAAGCRTILVEHPGSAHKRVHDARPDAIVPDLGAAAAVILSRLRL
jgi:D-glycero-D-manno-heptose 1,7-bisphosphate phosphatase